MFVGVFPSSVAGTEPSLTFPSAVDWALPTLPKLRPPPRSCVYLFHIGFLPGSIVQSHLLLDFSTDPALEGSQEMLALGTGIFWVNI